MTSTDTTVDHSRVVQKDRVVIRFAGDSGDGMQLTGDRFTSETAAFGNDLSTLPNFPAEIRAPAGTLPGVSWFQLHFANYDILTPGDRPDVLVAMNPAALKANIADLPPRRRAHRQHRRVHQAQPHQGRLRGQPARGRLARAVRGATRSRWPRSPAARSRTPGCRKKDAERAKNMFALGPAVVDVPPAAREHRAVPAGEVRHAARRSPRPTSSRSRPGYAYGETTEAFAVTYEVAPAHARGGHLPPDHRQHGAGVRHRRGRAGAAGCRCSWAPTRSPRRRTSCTSCPSTRTSTSPRSRPRTRSRASARRWARRSAGRWASPRRPGRASR